ncbi:hypothetical protein M3Y94_00986100 [Aphelenchoides besseyi]|nr:hypothetical protein M3Y94_00986100 [Aphelenchoides besseyi]KAI6221103.1 hypothetical protein M3Y95_01005600 [Aphelenchoides besseyi]
MRSSVVAFILFLSLVSWPTADSRFIVKRNANQHHLPEPIEPVNEPKPDHQNEHSHQEHNDEHVLKDDPHQPKTMEEAKVEEELTGHSNETESHEVDSHNGKMDEIEEQLKGNPKEHLEHAADDPIPDSKEEKHKKKTVAPQTNHVEDDAAEATE